MKLTDIDMGGLGAFLETPAAFQVSRFHVPAPWDYVYTNGAALLRVRHDGSGYLQLDPPGGSAVFRQAAGQTAPSVMVWLIPEDGPGAFSNFWLPTVPLVEPGAEPDEYRCIFAPESARYRLRHRDWVVETELRIAGEDPACAMTVALTNVAGSRRRCTLMPVVKPHLGPFALTPWDVLSNYQTAAFARLGDVSAVWVETRDPGGDPTRRLRVAVLSDFKPTHFEVSAEGFLGRGTWEAPEAVWRAGAARPCRRSRIPPYGIVTPANAVIGQPPLAAMSRTVTLAPGGRFQFSLVVGRLPDTPDGTLPPRSTLTRLARHLSGSAYRRELALAARHYARTRELRRIETPDPALDRYVNEWLPLQLDWVMRLDRGWPTGMRGTRDAAQDATAVVPLEPESARRRLAEVLSIQRTDGWFPRQYSTAGRHGQHDLRPYVDSGLWVWELLLEYLSYTRDFDFLSAELLWLDADRPENVLTHALRLLEYYVDPENLGEHGLCKIRGGDWNDSINRAGLQGRGESVMVSCQAVLALEQAAELIKLKRLELGPPQRAALSRKFRRSADALARNLLKHAMNASGYLNGVFTDAGQWVFSPVDPDGRARVNNPVNAWAVIAGVVRGTARDRVFAALATLKGPHGWRLFHPPIGHPPIDKLGRIGQGDLAPGIGENGTPYNHGSHGFLGRAAWTAGRGDLLYETLRYMFPYDQSAHPVAVARTAPYAVVNHWREAPGLEGTGGDTFLSGSISTAMRNVYRGLIGFRPGLEDLVIDPCIPAAWPQVAAEVPFLAGRYRIEIENPEGVEAGVVEVKLNGRAVGNRLDDRRLGRAVPAIPIDALPRAGRHRLYVRLGHRV